MRSETSPRARYVLGTYEILSTTGTGSSATVYQAYDPALGRTVALKVLHDDLRAQSPIVARFRREAETSARLRHPHIVPIYSVGASAGIPYIAMAYIDGASLENRLSVQGRLPWREALGIAGQVADALACAHQAQIIHRDIKPANILLDRQGQAYVTDFGIAKMLNSEVQLTVAGTRLGTPRYLCPERCRNRPTTPASDIYSLGVVLFQMLTGHMPFPPCSTVELLRKIATEPAARVRDFAPEIPEPVDRLVAHMLEKKPGDRPANARELRAAIERVRDGGTLEEGEGEWYGVVEDYRKSARPREETIPKTQKQIKANQTRHRQAKIIMLTALLMAFSAILIALACLRSVPLEGPLAEKDFGVGRWTAHPAPVVSDHP